MFNNFEILIDDSQPQDQVKKDCKGQIYRFSEDWWVGSDGDYNFRYRFRWIKSLSCDGCDQCGYIEDDMREQINSKYLNIGAMFDPDKAKAGQLYRLKVVDWSTDWETGVCDDWTVGFEEVKSE